MPIDYTKRPSDQPEPTPVSLSKVILTKAAPTVSLSKQGTVGGSLRVNLNWTARPAGAGGGGLLKAFKPQASTAIDLDLACLYELADGTKGVVQALGNALRSRNPGPALISLDGDDRSGDSADGENLRIDLSRLAEIRRVLVFAYIYEGSPNWAGANAVVTLFPAQGAPIELHLDESDPSARTCAIAMLVNTGSDLAVHREVRYINGTQSQLDAAYSWGMNWKAGRK